MKSGYFSLFRIQSSRVLTGECSTSTVRPVYNFVVSTSRIVLLHQIHRDENINYTINLKLFSGSMCILITRSLLCCFNFLFCETFVDIFTHCYLTATRQPIHFSQILIHFILFNTNHSVEMYKQPKQKYQENPQFPPKKKQTNWSETEKKNV